MTRRETDRKQIKCWKCGRVVGHLITEYTIEEDNLGMLDNKFTWFIGNKAFGSVRSGMHSCKKCINFNINNENRKVVWNEEEN